uniref:Phosphoribulokinase/uridine kinase domain-containing protein n=3 Tax=Rhodosorus marinus TaxID=101924 RepID=A0A7S2ZZW7_9RHOD|mmetsp:Transcript_3810/g.16512  ORF Transcript_3810/g.16512 Transcript_3810/m.16512 type:complete len:362 (+) Transcript_3810:521-1606(+)|eukprot:CAMPEP_0113957722 /NCGR_PEP_ID=MMETSP0011_2-20120614/2937_1 /TAXON_ID=101924 /ORGANISM="Rhodosorus marinus" /LENGTH=361 /DNA_ID=CAMNT_0000968335 /DNA_START=157 /DNA_END=1242 /DNA_ORIENTATION=- /assembly_acc=CAM_ASM_000156
MGDHTLGFFTGLQIGSLWHHNHGYDLLDKPRRAKFTAGLKSVAAEKHENPRLEVITSSPVFKKAGLDADMDQQSWAEWFKCAKLLNRELGRDATVDRVHKLYLPVFFWLKKQIREAKATRDGTMIVGLSCPQGGGKTTITNFLVKMFAAEGITCAIASTDDFYLTYDKQRELAETYASNPLLEFRGNPGTMDVDLMCNTVSALAHCGPGDEINIPRYNKSAYKGRGDRVPEEDWPTVKGPVDLVILEGWCMGFQPVENPSTSDIAEVNEFLKDFAKVYDLLDVMLVVEIADPEYVYDWRKQAEDTMKAKGKAGMTSAQLKDFVDRFMPAYKEYLPGLYGNGVSTELPQLNIKIDSNRIPID